FFYFSSRRRNTSLQGDWSSVVCSSDLVLRRHRGMWLDVSGIPPARLLEYFPRLSELADRVLWGTDWPSPGVKDMRLNIDQFLALPLSDPHKKAILETNALALFPAAR